MSWIADLLLGIHDVLNSAIPLPTRKALNFTGGLVATDNPTQKRIDVTSEANAEVLAATDLATPSTLMKRSGTGRCNRGGTSVDDVVQLNSVLRRGDVTDVRILEGVPSFDTADWAFDPDLRPVNITLGAHVTWSLKAPLGSFITRIRATVIGGGSHGDLPSIMPKLSLRRVRFSTGDGSEEASQSDTAADVSTFEDVHVIDLDLGDGAEADSDLQRWMVRVTAEDGEDAEVGFQVRAIEVTIVRATGQEIGRD